MHASVIRVRIYGKEKSERRHSDIKTEVIIVQIDADFDVLDFINLSQNDLGKIYRNNIIKVRDESIVIIFINHAFSNNPSSRTHVEFIKVIRHSAFKYT